MNFSYLNRSMFPAVRVADHPTRYALSDSTDPSFKSTCSHDHDLLCQRCQDLKDVLSDINTAIQRCQFEQEYDKEDVLYTFQEAVRAIQLWKSHQLRLLNQDAARTDCIDCLNDNSVLLIQDWAMNFLPRQYPRVFLAHHCGNQKGGE